MRQCEIDIPPLVTLSGARWFPQYASGINANEKRVHLSNGETLAYDVLSIDTGADTDHQALQTEMPGALEYGVFIRPLENLAQRWVQLKQSASRPGAPLVVVGGGAAGFELACALRARFDSAKITLITGAGGLAKNYPPATRARMLQALASRSIVLVADECARLTSSAVYTRSSGSVPSLQTWLATGSRAPSWLAGSGLQLDAQGYLAVNQYQQSCSHPEVFGAGDVASRMDHPHPRSGVFAVRAGPALARNLPLALEAMSRPAQPVAPLVPHLLPRYTLNLLSCGDKYAIASYGPWSAYGAWVWRCKDGIDRRFMRRYTPAP